MGLTIPQAEIISAGVGFMGNMIGSGAGAGYSHYEAEQNRKFQEYMYNRQVADTERFWRMQNEYNLPSAAYARELQGLKENNLNPYLIYGNGSPSGNLAEQPKLPSAPRGAQAQVGSFNTQIDLANLALLNAQKENIDADTNLKSKEAGKVGTETENLSFDLALKKDTRDLDIAQKSATYDLTKSMEALNREQRYYYRDQCNVLQAQVDSIRSDIENKKAMTATQIQDITTRLNKYLEEFPHIIANLDSQTRKNYADALAATVAARFQQELLDSGYANILSGVEGQNLLNAIKYGTGLDIENGLKALEFQSRPKAGSNYYAIKNFIDYVAGPSIGVLKDAAIGAGGFYMFKGAGSMGKIGFVK